nr:hypothetical protein [uncultured Methanoregula sp.]
MKNNVNAALVGTGIIVLLLIFVFSAGCIKYLPTSNGGDKGTTIVSSELPRNNVLSPPGNASFNQSPVVTPAAVVTIHSPGFHVNEVDPMPYVTQDPYKIPYRDLGNWSAGETARGQRTPQFSKKIILRSNSTAFQVNVTKGPLVIDLTCTPKFSTPDQTAINGQNSFVFSNAEVTVIDEISKAALAKDGYGGVYSSDLHKKITIYREGSFIVTLTGNFIDIDMAIITGSAPEQVPATPGSRYNGWVEE